MVCNLAGPSENWEPSLQIEERSKNGEGKITGPGLSQDACLFPDQKKKKGKQVRERERKRKRSESEIPYPRIFPGSQRDADRSCWVISAVNKWCQP